MLMHRVVFILLFVVFTTLQTHGQFSAGNGSGATKATTSVQYELYSGGNGDGYNDTYISLNYSFYGGGIGEGSSDVLAFITYASFNSGIGDGFSEISLIPNNAFFRGGDGDGESSLSAKITYPLFKSGQGDGYSNSTLAISYPLFLGGGDGDGFDVGDNNVYTGGNGDGFANTVAPVDYAAFSGGNGDGHSNDINYKTIYAHFSGGNGDGYADVTAQVRFIQLLTNVFGAFCAGTVLNISFYAPVAFDAGNIFTLQLSNAIGNFAAASSLGSVQATTSGNINGIIPANSVGGNQYRLRVIATTPSTPGVPSDSAITVNPLVDFYADADADLFGNISIKQLSCTQPVGFVADSTDCNDANTFIHPGAIEICSNDDENCNGSVDEGLDCSANLSVKLFIEGFYLGNDSMVAVVDPIGSPTACDSITVQLAQAVAPYAILFSSNGTINTHGNGVFHFNGAIQGRSFYVIIKHRNSIETWSKLPINFNTTTSFNFSQ